MDFEEKVYFFCTILVGRKSNYLVYYANAYSVCYSCKLNWILFGVRLLSIIKELSLNWFVGVLIAFYEIERVNNILNETVSKEYLNDYDNDGFLIRQEQQLGVFKDIVEYKYNK